MANKKQKVRLLEQLSVKDERILQLEQRNLVLLDTIADAVAENRRLTLVISGLNGQTPRLTSVPVKTQTNEAGFIQPATLHSTDTFRSNAQPLTFPSSDLNTPNTVNEDIEDPCAGIAPKKLAAINATKAPALVTNTKNMVYRGFHITDEQQHSADMVMGGGSLKIEAGSGTGKTSNLAAISYQQDRRSGLYLAFNSPVVIAAEKVFHHKTQCRTHHSLAYRALGHQYGTRLDARLTNGHVIKALNLQDYQELSAWSVASLIIAWVYKFAQGGDEEVSLKSVPWNLFVAHTKEGDKDKAKEIAKVYASDLQHFAAALWIKLADLNSLLPITPDIYLKAWALTKPQIQTDVILFDEAQDASGVMMHLIQAQQAQKIWVGDRRQQIYAWRGAVNAMDIIETDNVCTLTRSFRYGQPVAELANCILRNFLDEYDFSMVGNPDVSSVIREVKNPSAYICRTNRTAIAELMRALSKGRRVHMLGGTYELMVEIESAQALMEGGRPRATAFQIFKTWGELVEHSKTEVGADLAPLVKMLDRWPASTLLKALNQTKDVKEKDADLVIATAHRSKGKEYPSVKLAHDFPFPSGFEKDSKYTFTSEDANLLYVAATRARYELDISDCIAAQMALEGRL